MTAGKNKLLRWARLIYGGYDLSGDSRTFGDLDDTRAAIDMTGVSNTVANSLADRRVAGIKGYQALMNDATAGAWTRLLAGAGGSQRLSVMFGSLGEPVIGDPAYLLPSCQITNKANFDGSAAVINADFEVDTAQYADSIGNPWGVVLYNAALTDTANGDEVDNGAATSAGAHANLHITASSGGAWAFIIQESATGAWAGEEATLMTFTADGSAIASEQQYHAGAIAEFVRFQATITSGTCTAICTFARC